MTIDSIKTNPVPGVTVTRPAMDLDKAFEVLFAAVAAMPRFDESIAAKQRLVETNFWLRHALHIKDMHEKQMAEIKADEDKKATANSVREKVELKDEH